METLNVMERIFVYGTLQDPRVQQSVFGRVTDFQDDILSGFELGDVVINGSTYLIAIPQKESTIVGKVIEVTLKELELMDEYETAAYKRLKVLIESGASSWVYCQP